VFLTFKDKAFLLLTERHPLFYMFTFCIKVLIDVILSMEIKNSPITLINAIKYFKVSSIHE